MNVATVCLMDCIEEMGEERTEELLSTFSSPINPDVEKFLKKNAISFNKQHQAVTYLVLSEDTEELMLCGYFSLSLRPITVNCEGMSNTRKSKFRKVGKMNDAGTECSLPAFLIAQFGKNFIFNAISGGQLMKMTLETLYSIQYEIGGTVVFLEAEDHEKLLAFYQNDDNRFIPFDDRITNDGVKLIQLYRFI